MSDKPEVFVEIGSMAVKKSFDKKYIKTLPKVMQTAAEKAFKKAGMGAGGNTKGKQGFLFQGTVVDLTMKKKGAKSTIACKVSLLIATLPTKSMFGFMDGGAQVQTGSKERDIDFGAEDCVVAVIEDLIKKKAVKAIVEKAKAEAKNKKKAA